MTLKPPGWFFLLLLIVALFVSAEDVQADCESATAKVFRYQKILQGTSFNILATAVSRSPSVLETIESEKAERVVELSESHLPAENPKVLKLYFGLHYLLLNIHLVGGENCYIFNHYKRLIVLPTPP